MKRYLLFPVYFITARFIRILLNLFDKKGPAKAAFIACYRDNEDVRRFGYWNINQVPDVLPWLRYEWEGVKGHLFMIGSITDQLIGDKATDESKERGRQQFIKAARSAIKNGAEVILLAAGGTKRLFTSQRLKELFPETVSIKHDGKEYEILKTIFGVGDNFAGLLLGECILKAFQLSKINPRAAKALVIGPYGFLGSVAVRYLQQAGCEVLGMSNPKNRRLLKRFAEKHGFRAVYSFTDVAREKIDMVVACSSADKVCLTPDIVNAIRKDDTKLIVVDPCQPENMTADSFAKCQDKVIRYDAGNGFSPRLNYILGWPAYKLLRMAKNVAFGCFCETFILAKHPEIRNVDWFEVSPKNIEIISKYFGGEIEKFDLPQPLCFNKPVNVFLLASLMNNIVVLILRLNL